MANKIGTGNRVTQADLDPKQARIGCAVYDNGRTPGSSASNFGSVDFVRFSWPLISKGLSLHGETLGEGQLIGPAANWTPQFTDNTAQNGKAGTDPTRWVPYFNEVIDLLGKSEKTCAAYAVYPAFTWRAVKVTSVDPCFQAGAWSLCRTDRTAAEGNEITVFPVLPEEQIIKAWCREVAVKGEIKIEWYTLNEETEEFEEIEWPTWQPYQGAPPEKIPFDCWIDCRDKFDPIIAPDAVSSCNNYDVVFLCAFDGEPLPDLSNQVEELALYQWDCDGERISEIYTLDTYNQSLLPNADPLDPESDQWVPPEGTVIANCNGAVFVAPEVEAQECAEADVDKCLVSGCESGFIASLGRPSGGVWTLTQSDGKVITGDNYGDYRDAMLVAGYCEWISGPSVESHRFCPFPAGATLSVNGENVELVQVLYEEDKERWPKPPIYKCVSWTVGKNDDRRDELLAQNNVLLQCLKDLWTKDPLADDAAIDDLCDFSVQFKSAGLDTLVTDKGTITITPPNNDFSSTTGSSPQLVAAQAQIQAFLDANGGGTVALSYPSDSNLDITITGTSCTFVSADDNSNPGPHEFTKTGGLGDPEEHTTETNGFDPDRGQRWDSWIAQGNGQYTIQAPAGAGSEGWINTWANGNDQQVGVAYFALARIALYSGPPNSGAAEKSDGYILIAPNQLTGNGGSPSTAVYDPTIDPVFSAGNVTCSPEQMLGLLTAQGFSLSEATELVTNGTTQGLALPSNGQCWSNGDFVTGQPFGLWGVGA